MVGSTHLYFITSHVLILKRASKTLNNINLLQCSTYEELSNKEGLLSAMYNLLFNTIFLYEVLNRFK